MEHCPTEIIQEFLFSIPDFESLQHLILTSRGFLGAFKDREASILREILARIIPPALWFDAVAAFMASQMADQQDRRVREQFLEFYLARDIRSFRSEFRPRLSDCRALANFYEIVEIWSSDFTDNTLGSHSIHGDHLETPQSAVPVSDSEKTRIQRCLYRFEIFCKVFCAAPASPANLGEERVIQYLNHFAPWEHEQFACIRDFMTKVLRSELPQSGETILLSPIEIIRPRVPATIEYHISRGLGHTLAVVRGEPSTPPDFSSAEPTFPSPSLLYDHLRWTLPNDATLVGALWTDISAEEESENITQVWCPDGDHGPQAIWRRAYQMESVMHCVDNPWREALRDWGYVFWDHSRLQSLGVFKLQWDSNIQLWV